METSKKWLPMVFQVFHSGCVCEKITFALQAGIQSGPGSKTATWVCSLSSAFALFQEGDWRFEDIFDGWDIFLEVWMIFVDVWTSTDDFRSLTLLPIR